MRGAAGLVLLAAMASACRTGYAKTAELHHAETERCVANEQAILSDCRAEHNPVEECRDRIAAERRRCDMILADICRNGKGCP